MFREAETFLCAEPKESLSRKRVSKQPDRAVL